MPSTTADVSDSSKRTTLQVLASVEVAGTPGRKFANLVELSSTDMTLETQHLLDDEAVLTVTFFLPGTLERLSIQGLVLNALATDEQRYLLNLVDLPDGTRANLDTFLGQRSQR